MDNGYIRLHRAITAWEWYDDVNTFKVFLHLLLTCNWQEKKWRGHTIYPGQRVVSLATLADETKLSIMQVRNTINHLVLTGSITRSKIGKVGLITVNNWEKYQQGNTVSNSEVTQNQNENQQRNNIEITTNEEREEGKERKKNITYPIVPPTDVFAECAGGSQELLEALRKFAEMRKSIKKPMTERAKELLVKKLEKLAEPYRDKERYKLECVNQSILNSWQGLFPLKDFEDSAPAQETVEMPDEWPTYKPGMSWEDLIP